MISECGVRIVELNPFDVECVGAGFAMTQREPHFI
jgi:hypothetical protein